MSNVDSLCSADERAKVLAWLSPLDPRIHHHDIRAQRVKPVGEWLLQAGEYKDWYSGARLGKSDNSALFCCGDPGVGKTYISSLVIDTLGDRAREQNAAIACFYFDFATQKEQSPAIILGSLLKQFVGGLKKIPEKVLQAFRGEEQVIGGRKLELREILHMLKDISSSQPTFICIDALDECMAEYRGKVLDSLKQILHNSENTRVFLTGRLHIQDEVENHLSGKVVAVSITPTKDDVIRFLQAKLKEDITPDAMDKSLEQDIIRTIPGTCSDIFLLVSLNIEAILKETTLHRRREKLEATTNGLCFGDVYDTTIRRIKAQDGDRPRLGIEALMWISHSERSLKVDEICEALAVEIGSTDINTNNVPSIRTVLNCCQGLATVDKESSTTRLIRPTLKEYLSHHPDLFDRPHSKIAETCLTYLNFQKIKALSIFYRPDPRSVRFLEYSSLHWGTHMRMELSSHSRYLARLLLCHQYSYHVSARLLWESVVEQSFYSSIPFSALHCISYFGISEVVIEFVKSERWDVNRRDRAGLTPLMWAALYGREDVVKLLLKRKEIQPDMADTKYGRTALSWASKGGREGVVKIFLDPLYHNPGDIAGRWGKTPQVMGVLSGGKYINPNRRDGGGKTPLLLAVENGHDGVVRLLLEQKDVRPDLPDNDGQTPLSWAAKHGHQGVVKLLLERKDIQPDMQDNDGQTPLWLAILNRHKGVVRLLLQRADVNPNWPDDCGRTPLWWAVDNKHEGLVKLLLVRKDVIPDKPGSNGETPLSIAAKSGHDGIVRLLLERKDLRPHMPNNLGQTPLWLAAQNGHNGVIKLLLGRADVRPNWGYNGVTLLQWATDNGRNEVVKLLSERKDLIRDKSRAGGKTLSWQDVRDADDKRVEVLLKGENVNPNIHDNRRRTLLWFAVENGREGVVRLLLAQRHSLPDFPDDGGQTALSLAARNGHNGIVKLLLARKDVSPDWPDNHGQTPLSWAAKNGHFRVAKLLLGRKDVSPDRPDDRGQTPLSWAASNGHCRVVWLLLGRENVRHDRPDKDGQTPLSRALWNGHNNVVKLFAVKKGSTPRDGIKS